MTNFRYAYCTAQDLMNDLGLNGSGENFLTRFIEPATQYLVQEIGQFIPTSEIRTFPGSGKKILFVAPVLSISKVMNDEIELVATDYLMEPNGRMWQNGPFVRLNCDLDESTAGLWIPEADAIAITGTWGLYDKSITTGTSLGVDQLIGDTSLEVAHGGLISQGMVLLIGTEMQFVSALGDPSAAITTLGAGCNSSDETLTVASSTGLNIGEIIRVDFERMKITDKRTGQIQVTRGWDNTTKTIHTTAAGVDVYRTYTVERGVNGTAAAAHSSAAEIDRYAVPADINYLCRQIAALMLRKSQTGYAGRAGSPETGETFYNHEFPRDVIARIKANYYIPAAR